MAPTHCTKISPRHKVPTHCTKISPPSQGSNTLREMFSPSQGSKTLHKKFSPSQGSNTLRKNFFPSQGSNILCKIWRNCAVMGTVTPWCHSERVYNEGLWMLTTCLKGSKCCLMFLSYSQSTIMQDFSPEVFSGCFFRLSPEVFDSYIGFALAKKLRDRDNQSWWVWLKGVARVSVAWVSVGFSDIEITQNERLWHYKPVKRFLNAFYSFS